jgi:uncharacterized membrane protein HdeD (DUF308 family)
METGTGGGTAGFRQGHALQRNCSRPSLVQRRNCHIPGSLPNTYIVRVKETTEVASMSEISYEESLCTMKWGTFVLIGIMSLVFGILFFIFPELTAEVIVILIGVIMIVLAILSVTLALMSRAGDSSSVLLLIGGVLGFLVGVGAIVAPVLFGALLSIIIGVVLFVIGIVNISIAIGERTLPHRWILFLLGLVSIVFAVLLMAYPVLGLVFLFGYLVGIYFVIYGILSLIAGLAIRKIAGDICTV